MLLGVIIAVESKLIICSPPNCSNLYLFQDGSRRILAWILLLDSQLLRKGFDLIWVIVDQLTKSAHFIPVSTRYRPHEYVALHTTHIVRLHGVPRTIVSNKGSQFTAWFWEHLHKQLDTNLVQSLAYHP